LIGHVRVIVVDRHAEKILEPLGGMIAGNGDHRRLERSAKSGVRSPARSAANRPSRSRGRYSLKMRLM
jgi:hypothetical protein